MRIYFQNIRGVNTRAHHVRSAIEGCSYDIILLCETWMQPGFNNAELFPTGPNVQKNFIVYRKDRDLVRTGKKTGGGVVIAVRASIRSSRMFEFEYDHSDLEMIWVRLQLDIPVYLCCAYLPDRAMSATYHRFFKSLSNNIASITEPDAKILISCDLNMPSITWTLQSSGFCEPTEYLLDDTGDANAALIHTTNCFDLKQYNRYPNANGRYLDLVLSDIEPSMIGCYEPSMILSDHVDAHHPPIEINLHVHKPTYLPANQPQRFAFRKLNYYDLIEQLNSIDWFNELVGDVDLMTQRFYQLLNVVIARHTPLKHQPGQYPVWFSCSVVHMLDRKRQLHREYKRTGDINVYNEFKKLRTAVKMKITRCHRKYLLSVENEMTSHMKQFWQYTKSLRKTNTYPTEMHYVLPGAGMLSASDSISIAGLFRLFFSSVYRVCLQPASYEEPKTETLLDGFQVNEQDIAVLIKEMDDDKGAGTDGLPSHFVKMAAPALIFPLMLIFNASLAAGVFPILFKSTLIHPVFKAGRNNDVMNYRPIAVLNCFAKLLERLVHQKLLAHVSGYLDPSQHGFLPKRSTVTNLLEYVTFLSEKLETKDQVDMIYMDLSKAFDTISHDQLISKLQVFGVTGDLLRWVATYLMDRPNAVVFNGERSERFFPTSGVPQGSILGPLLFLLYIDDLAAKMSSFKSMFADDKKFGRLIDDVGDCQQLQTEFHEAEKWCEENSLSSNASKCCVITVTNKNNPIEFPYASSTGQPITRVTTVKDLGVHVDETLRFNYHVETIVNKAFKSLGFLIRTSRQFMLLKTVMHLYRALVVPHLEYASPVWNPCYNKYMDSIESVQRRFTRFVFRKFHLPYADYETRCKKLGLLTLRRRRILHDQMLLYDIVRGRKKVDSTLVSIGRRTETCTRSRDVFLERTWRLRSTFSSPLPRMLRHYNRYFFLVDIFSENRSSYRSKVSGMLWTMHSTPE